MTAKNEISSQIVIDNGTVEDTIEANIDLPELSLVRMDMNIIEYPLFSKNRRRKINQAIRYKLNGRSDRYIEVKPISGETVPGDFEEKVFISLIKIMRKNNYSRNFAVTISEIASNMGVSAYSKKAIHGQIKLALVKLSETSYTFKNSLYSSLHNELISETIVTNMMGIKIYSRVSANEEEKEKYFKDGRVKEVYLISISQHFYDNIINKGYLVFDSNLLLGITSSVARAIYMLITKLRFDQLVYKISLISLAGRIPLKIDSNNIGRSARSIENACKELKNKNLLLDYKIIKNKNWESTEIEFYFEEIHNKIKQDNFFLDRDIFKGLYLNVLNIDSENSTEDFYQTSDSFEVTEENINKILNALPPKAKKLKTIPNLIAVSIRSYGFNRVLKSAIYTKAKKADKVYAYFKKAIENNYGINIAIENLNKKEEQKQLGFDKLAEKLTISEENFPYYEEFQKFDSETQFEICSLILNKMLKDLKTLPIKGKFKEILIKNSETQFENNKPRMINDYLKENYNYYIEKVNTLKKEKFIEKKEQDENYLEKNNIFINQEKKLSIDDIKEYISKSIKGYSAIILLDSETEKRLRKELSFKIVPLLTTSDVSKAEIDEIIKKEIEKI